jgi:hypothetical protein
MIRKDNEKIQKIVINALKKGKKICIDSENDLLIDGVVICDMNDIDIKTNNVNIIKSYEKEE